MTFGEMDADSQVATQDEPVADDVYYRLCAAARDTGAAPLHVSDPGYGKYLDRDGDGVACE